jgi:tetratricopeptide (TPR) repeat protein
MSDASQLAELARQAWALQRAGEISGALTAYQSLIVQRPDWEHGYGMFNLAECYEELNKLPEAREAYERAVQFAPADTILLGGLASFLFLHGDSLEAFAKHLELLKLERRKGDKAGADQTMVALNALGDRLGWSKEEVATRVQVNPGSAEESIDPDASSGSTLGK